ncbi:MAG TPA: class I SAM-dependent methyltransferase [Marinobacterium sp.]|nr:class I SAM-dependent methyltransferase [Marinobacterium sp.]
MLAIAAEPDYLNRAASLAQRQGLPLLEEWDLDDDSTYQQLLLFDVTGVSLCSTGRKRSGPVRVDFLSGAVNHRRQFGGGQGQQIAKACGINSAYKPFIADLTAGLGRDAFVLATLGSQVQMVERNPLVSELLEDGLFRAQQSDDPQVSEIIGRLSLFKGQGGEWLASHPSRADVVYLDPMFPHSHKSAQVKKEMLAFRSLVGADEDSESLLAIALESARCRVVVKRPRIAPSIRGPKPSYALEGKSGRFDIYALRKLEPPQ